MTVKPILIVEDEPASDAPFMSDKIIPIRELELMAIEHALRVCKGNVQEAALRLKISPATLYRKKPAEK
ncbi:MAG: helix-turn-helix domain-containing protein [Alphaproteobacteria bacterium]|nr:helix-turn-helix domain-containing protein [Alphaproteobacteria bacterium]